MAKGQRRGNREVKKPKKDKSATPAAPMGAAWTTVEKLEEREKLARRKK